MSDFVLYHIIINNIKVSSTGMILKYTGLYIKRFRITIFLNIAVNTQVNHKSDIAKPAFF